jgi:hypothetical protein
MPTSNFDVTQDPDYQQLMQAFQGYRGGPGTNWYWGPNTTPGFLNTAGNKFSNVFQQQTGRAPTVDEINSFLKNEVIPSYTEQAHPEGWNPLTGSELQTMAQSYVPTAYSGDVQSFQQKNASDLFNKQLQQTQDLYSKNLQNLQAQVSGIPSQIAQEYSPSGQAGQQLLGQFNNLGISPGSGAFQSGLGSAVANQTIPFQQSILSGYSIPNQGTMLGIPGEAMQYGLGQYGGMQGLGNQYTGQSASSANKYIDFAMQELLAKQLAETGNPSGAQGMLGMATGSAQGLGSLLSGGAQAYKATWICTAMAKHQVLGKYEVKRLHDHLFQAFFKRFWKFFEYFVIGKFVVLAAEFVHTDWDAWRTLFYDRVISESDPVKAVDLYEESFWMLAKKVKHDLRVKFMLFYDNPMEKHT